MELYHVFNKQTNFPTQVEPKRHLRPKTFRDCDSVRKFILRSARNNSNKTHVQETKNPPTPTLLFDLIRTMVAAWNQFADIVHADTAESFKRAPTQHVSNRSPLSQRQSGASDPNGMGRLLQLSSTSRSTREVGKCLSIKIRKTFLPQLQTRDAASHPQHH